MNSGFVHTTVHYRRTTFVRITSLRRVLWKIAVGGLLASFMEPLLSIQVSSPNHQGFIVPCHIPNRDRVSLGSEPNRRRQQPRTRSDDGDPRRSNVG